MTQGKKNLNAILGTKIHFIKEGLGFVPKNKKKYDVKTVIFILEKEWFKEKSYDKIEWLL